MRWTLLVGSIPALLPGAMAGAQSTPPEWRLSEPRLVLSGEALELHRVRGAAFMSDGRIVVADAGNSRLLVVSPTGTLIRSLGRSGAGPGDIRLTWKLAVVDDTILTYDTGLNRISLWTPASGFVRSVPLVGAGYKYELEAFITPSRFVVISRTGGERTEAGLYTESATVLDLDGRTGATRTISTHQWDLRFLHQQSNGSTTYATPFLGSAMIAAVGERMLTVPLAAAHVEIGSISGGSTRSVPLPVVRRPFDRSLLNAYRDSLLRLVRRSTAPAPGAEDRINAVFGPSFPVPENRPVIESVETVGPRVWMRQFPEGRETTTWYIADLVNARLAAQIELPTGWRVLGGDATRVIVLQRDADGVDSVIVRDLIIPLRLR